MPKRIALALLAASLILAGCASFLPGAEETITGSGVQASETRPVSGFTAVSFTSSGEAEITFGDEESITIEAEDNLLPFITTDVRFGTLVIGMQSLKDLRPTRPIHYTIITKRLTDVEISGSADVNVPDLAADQFTVTIRGSGTVTAAGQAERVTATLSGSGAIELGDLRAKSAEANIPGSGTITVWPSEALRASVPGSGTIQYYGAPADLTQDIRGSGAVTKLGDK